MTQIAFTTASPQISVSRGTLAAAPRLSSLLPRRLGNICDGCPAKGLSCRHRHGPRQLYAYWMRRRGGRPWPPYADVQPLLFGRMQPSLFLVDVEAERRFRYWQVGAMVDAIHGLHLAGRAPGEVWAPEVAHMVERQYADVVQTGQPRCYHPALLDGDGSYRYHTRLVLPLSSNGRDVDMLLGGLFPQALRYAPPSRG
jgi:hypothetical protein